MYDLLDGCINFGCFVYIVLNRTCHINQLYMHFLKLRPMTI